MSWPGAPPVSFEQGIQPADWPEATVGGLYANSVGERRLPQREEDEVLLPEKGTRVPSRQKRWIVSHRPDSRFTRPPWLVNGYCTSWTWLCGQGSSPGVTVTHSGLSHLPSSLPGRLSAVTTTWTRRSRRTSVCSVAVMARPATPSQASLMPMTSAEVGLLPGSTDS